MAKSSPPCRFCLEKTHTKANPLIQPCECKGSVENVHLICLVTWRQMTENPIAKYKCQLCVTDFKFPTLWKRQQNLLLASPFWYVLQKSYLFGVVTQFLHLYLQEGLENYNSLESRQLFRYLLFIDSAIYFGFYMYLFSNISEKKIYLYYASVKQLRFQLLSIILAVSYIGTYLSILPFGYVYISFLPHVVHIHETIIETMNTDCEIVAL